MCQASQGERKEYESIQKYPGPYYHFGVEQAGHTGNSLRLPDSEPMWQRAVAYLPSRDASYRECINTE